MLRPTSLGLMAAVAAAVAATAAAPASAHFPFVLPDAGGRHGQLVLSEELAPDAAVSGKLLAGATLTATDSAGRAAPVAVHPTDHAATLDLPLSGPRVVHGSVDAGTMAHDPAHPFRVVYYPKAVFGDPFDKRADDGPVELTAVGHAGAVAFRFTAAGGRPVADAVVTVIGPDGEAARVKTAADGTTRPFAVPGRYGAWAKTTTPAGGSDVEARRYATLVVDAPAPVLPPMAQPAASFGAVAVGGWAYVYGGHIVPTHDYSTASVSGQFHRLKLDGGTAWDPLPGGPPLQGMNLATDGRYVYRVGGMQPMNPPGHKADVRSVADVARYDPSAGRWDPLPPLPTPRSSHDLAVVGHTLYVVGGWDLAGDPSAATFATDAVSLDLSQPAAAWQRVAQPFTRRALTVAVHAGKVYAVGGFDAAGDPSLKVDVFDPAAKTWATAPDLPGPDDNGFGPAAVVDGSGRLVVSVADGTVCRLDDRRNRWDKVAATTPRIVHRAVADGGRVLILGGASGKRQLDLVEIVADSN